MWFFPFILAKWLLVLAYFYLVYRDSNLQSYHYGVSIFYFIQVFVILREIFFTKFKKPKLTILAVGVIGLTVAAAVVIFAVPLLDSYFWLIFIDLLIPVLVAFFVFLFSFPVEIYTDLQIERAVARLKERPDLLIIGVTGSNGKSGTKDVIARVLARKFTVIKTHGSDNTAFGIARTINSRLKSDTDVFVSELSAYKRGEIKALCHMLRPKIGVLTEITNHHVSLFKNLDNIKKTNRELIEALPKDGFCLFNGRSKNTFELFRQSRKQKVLYTFDHNTGKSAEIVYKKNIIIAQNIVQKNDKTFFTILIDNKLIRFALPRHNSLEHVLPAIYLAHYLGMKQTEIQQAVSELK